MRLKDKVAVVTGAGSGFGAGIAQGTAWAVVLVGCEQRVSPCEFIELAAKLG